MLLPLIFNSPTNVVELGLGGGNLLRYLHYLLPKVHLSSIESNSEVVSYFHQFFNPSNIPFTIKNTDAIKWMADCTSCSADWLLCDIYQHSTSQVDSDEFYLMMLNEASPKAWLTINLPDLETTKLERTLKVLSVAKQQRKMVYFSTPQYKNIIVHLSPMQGTLPSHANSPLPHYQLSRWTSIWRHGMKPFI